jgi:pimeloyl-ACP methyl ester carboxylesterase
VVEKRVYLEALQVIKMVIDFANKIVNHIPITPQEVKKLLSMSFGSGWVKLHPNYLETIPKAEDLFAGIPSNTQMQQIEAVQSWMATNWTGVCWELTKISNTTLVITGTDDNFYEPHANALIIAGKIPGAWLVQIKDAGHAVLGQYRHKINKVLQTL